MAGDSDISAENSWSHGPHPDILTVIEGRSPWAVVTGDCLDVLKTLPAGCVDAVVTDPPYGTGWVRGGLGVGEFEAKHDRPDWDRWDPSWLGMIPCERYAVFCPTSRAREIDGTPCWYKKTNPRPGGPTREAVVVKPTPWCAPAWEFSAYNGDTPLHPCQKDIRLMKWALSLVEGAVVLDPFCGSGTTGVACIQTGRRFIGIEIDEKYAAIARRRIADAAPLFVPPPAPAPARLFTEGA